MLCFFRLFFCFFFSVMQVGWCAQKPLPSLKVVVTLPPLHSVMCGLMQGRGQPFLLLPGDFSVHAAALRPSDLVALQKADLVVWVGESFQPFLTNPLKNISNKKILTLLDHPEIGFFSQRAGHAWHSCDHHHEGPHSLDGHVWLDPIKVKTIARLMAALLIEKDPHFSFIYKKNLENVLLRLDFLNKRLRSILLSVQNKSFFVLHDTYQYFEKRYHLKGKGAVFLSHDMPLSAKYFQRLMQKMKEEKNTCLFLEPQFQSHKFLSLLKNIKTKQVDPLGASQVSNSDSYEKIMEKLAWDVRTCLE